MDEIREVTLKLFEADCKWLFDMYGPTWKERIEQHIHAEVVLRSKDALGLRKPWDY